MRHPLLGLGFAFAMFGAGPAALAAPVGVADVPGMVSASELIVVGRATQVRSLGVQTPATTFFVAVDRTLKGSLPSRRGVNVVLNVSGPGTPSVVERQYGIFFLHRGAGGRYEPTDIRRPTLIASPVKDGRQTASSPLGRVANELAGVLATSSGALTDPATGVQRLVVGDAATQAQFVYRDAVAALRTIPYASAGAAIDRALGSDKTMTRLWGLNALLYMGKSDALERRKIRALEAVKTTLLDPGPDLAVTATFLASAISGHVKSPDAVPVMAALLESKDVTVRRAAADVLSDIATPAAIAPLAKIALNDADQDVRYFAVLGLAAATGSSDVPVRAQFGQQESELLQRWHGWAATNLR